MRNPLMWKLLRKHISKAQLIGFAIANMVGLTIVLLGLQFWQDVRPVFEDEDSFIRKDYLVVTKSIGTASLLKVLRSSTAFEELTPTLFRKARLPTSSGSRGCARWDGSRQQIIR